MSVLRRGLPILLLVTTLALVYTWLGPYVVYPEAGGGFYTIREIRFGILNYYTYRCYYAVYGYFIEQVEHHFRIGRAIVSAVAALATLIVVPRIGRRFK